MAYCTCGALGHNVCWEDNQRTLLHGFISHLQPLQIISALALQTSSLLLKMLRSELSPAEHRRRARTGIPPVAHFLSTIAPEATHFFFFFCSVLDRKRTIKLLKAFLFYLHQFWLVVAVSLQTLNWSSATPTLPLISFFHVIHFWLQRARKEHDVFCMQGICPLPHP